MENAAAEILARRRDEVRRLYPFYVAVNKRALVPAPESPGDLENADAAALESVEQWFGAVDERAEAHQLRELLQTGFPLDAAAMGALVARHLRAADDSDRHRDKLDFLLVQFLAQEIPPDSQDISHLGIAAVMQPILGESANFAWMDSLDECVAQVNDCRCLREFMARRIFDRGRELKAAAGPVYFSSPAMLAFTRFNFLVRRGFIRVLLSDLKDIREALAELEGGGVQVVDATAAGLSASEPLKNIARLCKQWERPFQGKHSDQDWIHRVIELRALLADAVEELRARPPAPEPVAETAPPPPPPPEPEHIAAAEPAGLPEPVKVAEPAAPPPPLIEVVRGVAVAATTPPGVAATVVAPSASAKNTPIAATAAAPAAQKTAPPTPPVAQAAPAPVASEDPAVVLDKLPAQIGAQLESARVGKSASVTVAEAKITLASWEVAAFMDVADAAAPAVQRAVAIRAMLQASKPQKAELTPWLNLATAEVASLRERAGAARQANDTTVAMALSMCARSLAAAVEQARARAR